MVLLWLWCVDYGVDRFKADIESALHGFTRRGQHMLSCDRSLELGSTSWCVTSSPSPSTSSSFGTRLRETWPGLETAAMRQVALRVQLRLPNSVSYGNTAIDLPDRGAFLMHPRLHERRYSTWCFVPVASREFSCARAKRKSVGCRRSQVHGATTPSRCMILSMRRHLRCFRKRVDASLSAHKIS